MTNEIFFDDFKSNNKVQLETNIKSAFYKHNKSVYKDNAPKAKAFSKNKEGFSEFKAAMKDGINAILYCQDKSA